MSTTSARIPGHPTRGSWRLLRVGVLAGASSALALGAHRAGGGHVPGPALVALVVVAIAAVAVPLTARRCRLPIVGAVLSVEQAVLHWVLENVGAGRCVPPGPADVSHLHRVVPTMSCTPASPHEMHWPMIVAHVLATALTAWLLTKAESALWALTDRIMSAAAPTTSQWPSPAAAAIDWASTPEFPVIERRGADPRGPPAVPAR